MKHTTENVLVLQGGGSLGAYECGVYKALYNYGIKFDIVAGTSIGALNAAIIAGTKNNNPIQDLENFWLTVAEKAIPEFVPENIRPTLSVMYGSTYGNRNLFKPKWIYPQESIYFYLNSPYLYDVTPLKNTLSNYINFTKLSIGKKSGGVPRLIVTATDLQNGDSVTFDSMSIDIDADHIISCVSFPFYGISWTQKDGRYLWDGSLQSNTPLREVIDVSPRDDKNVYIVNLFPRKHQKLPSNMLESWHRARDIVHTDKTLHNIRMSSIISRYIRLLERMHEIIISSSDGKTVSKFRQTSADEYDKLVQQRGAIIRHVVRIERREDTHFLFEDADFSFDTIKHLIRQGEQDAEEVLKNYQHDQK
jgi:NTE family protein